MKRQSGLHRELRERQFQARVLAALEKPKSGRLIRAINAPFFLWSISLILITMGGGYFTKYQECQQEYTRLVGDYSSLVIEISERRQAFATTLSVLSLDDEINGRETSVASVRTILKQVPYTYSRYKDATLFELARSLDQIATRIDPIDNPISNSSAERSKKPWFIKFDSLSEGKIPDGMETSEQVKELISFLDQMRDAWQQEFFKAASFRIAPNCGFSTLWDRVIWGYEGLIIRRSSDPPLHYPPPQY